jgi:nicotinate phosphoribosyltransferase
MLDQEGLGSVRIFASGGLDEFEVDELVRGGATIDAFGVGTKMGVSADAPTPTPRTSSWPTAIAPS